MTNGTILVVCAANICRSPAAADLLARRLALAGSSLTVRSAGVTAVGDRPVCDLAMSLVGVYSAPDSHRSRRLTEAMVAGADLVVGMEAWHVERVLELAGRAQARLLDDEPIPDPHAIGYQSHALVFDRLRSAVDRLAVSLVGGA